MEEQIVISNKEVETLKYTSENTKGSGWSTDKCTEKKMQWINDSKAKEATRKCKNENIYWRTFRYEVKIKGDVIISCVYQGRKGLNSASEGIQKHLGEDYVVKMSEKILRD